VVCKKFNEGDQWSPVQLGNKRHNGKTTAQYPQIIWPVASIKRAGMLVLRSTSTDYYEATTPVLRFTWHS